jgi:hypothetical protein
MRLNNIPGRGNSTVRTSNTEGVSDLVRLIKKLFNLSTASSDTITTSLSSIETILLRSNWTTVANNSIVYTYDVNNNVILAEYFSGATLVFSQGFTYDVNNNCISITVS